MDLSRLITPDQFILIAIFLLVGFPVHEFCHAFVAYRLGDATAKMFGRLTLNPIVHFDPIGGLFLIVSVLAGTGFVFGWAKPTPVNPGNLRDRRNGEVLVSLAGPASNLVMACVDGDRHPGPDRRSTSTVPDIVGQVLYQLRRLQRRAGDLQLHPDPAARWRDACCSASCRCATRGNCGRS